MVCIYAYWNIWNPKKKHLGASLVKSHPHQGLGPREERLAPHRPEGRARETALPGAGRQCEKPHLLTRNDEILPRQIVVHERKNDDLLQDRGELE